MRHCTRSKSARLRRQVAPACLCHNYRAADRAPLPIAVKITFCDGDAADVVMFTDLTVVHPTTVSAQHFEYSLAIPENSDALQTVPENSFVNELAMHRWLYLYRRMARC